MEFPDTTVLAGRLSESPGQKVSVSWNSKGFVRLATTGITKHACLDNHVGGSSTRLTGHGCPNMDQTSDARCSSGFDEVVV